jgi:hypothetical protein
MISLRRGTKIKAIAIPRNANPVIVRPRELKIKVF